MSNGDGGHIFVGVAEVSGRGISKDWPRLDGGKHHEATVYNKAGSETSPPVRPQAKTSTGPNGKQLVAIRVEPGATPPYFAKNRGVFVRAGERDTHANLRTLEALFARREDRRALATSGTSARTGTGRADAGHG